MDNSVTNKNVVVFQAHPDDMEISLAGTLSLLAKKGWKIHVATLTSGQLGGFQMNIPETVRTRRVEAQNSAACIGATYEALSGMDGSLFDTYELRMECLDVIRKYNAGVVFTHHPRDYHADHRAAGLIVEIACMFATLENAGTEKPISATPLLYHTSTLRCLDQMGNYMRPDFYVNNTSEIEMKTQMINCHITQKELMRIMHKMDDFLGAMLAQDKLWGSDKESGFGMAEAFYQHRGAGFQITPLIQQELRDFVKINTNGQI